MTESNYQGEQLQMQMSSNTERCEQPEFCTICTHKSHFVLVLGDIDEDHCVSVTEMLRENGIVYYSSAPPHSNIQPTSDFSRQRYPKPSCVCSEESIEQETTPNSSLLV